MRQVGLSKEGKARTMKTLFEVSTISPLIRQCFDSEKFSGSQEARGLSEHGQTAFVQRNFSCLLLKEILAACTVVERNFSCVHCC